MRAEGTDKLLDSPEKLNAFLSIAYQASLLREEGRPVECRIALIGLQHLEQAILKEAGFIPFVSRNAGGLRNRKSAGWGPQRDFIDR